MVDATTSLPLYPLAKANISYQERNGAVSLHIHFERKNTTEDAPFFSDAECYEGCERFGEYISARLTRSLKKHSDITVTNSIKSSASLRSDGVSYDIIIAHPLADLNWLKEETDKAFKRYNQCYKTIKSEGCVDPGLILTNVFDRLYHGHKHNLGQYDGYMDGSVRVSDYTDAENIISEIRHVINQQKPLNLSEEDKAPLVARMASGVVQLFQQQAAGELSGEELKRQLNRKVMNALHDFYVSDSIIKPTTQVIVDNLVAEHSKAKAPLYLLS